jgi:protein O-mannosyl-transferase
MAKAGGSALQRLAGPLGHALVVMALLAVSVGLYAWTVDFPMVFDDHMYLKDNPILKDAGSFRYPAHFAEFVNLPSKIGEHPDLASSFILRPVAYATFHLNYALDGFNPRWFRALNILIHAANAVLIYALLSLLVGRGEKSGTRPRGSIIFIPATAALLFAAHPLATESVTYIIQRFTSLSALFYLATLWLYVQSIHAASRWGKRALRTSAVVVLVLGMQTKECTFTAPIVAVMIDCLVIGATLRTAVWRALPLLLCLPIIPMLVIMTSAAQHGGGFSLANALNIVNRGDEPREHWHYMVTQTTVVMAYLQRILWPAGLNLDPEWPVYRSLLETPVLLAMSVLAALTAGACWVWRTHRADVRARLAFVFTLWFFVTVSVSSGIVPLPDVMADHRSYLPSVGIFALVACLLDGLRTWNWQPVFARSLAPGLAVLCTGALAWTTCVRNQVWRTPERLWEDAVAKSPGKYRTWGNLGSAYSLGGNQDEAVKCYRRALEIEPRHGNSMFNLSNSLLLLNRPEESLETTSRLIETDKAAANNPAVVYTLALALQGVGRFDEALSVLTNLTAAMPDYHDAHKALGIIYLKRNQMRFALRHFQVCAKIKTPDTEILSAIKKAEAELMTPNANPPFRLR